MSHMAADCRLLLRMHEGNEAAARELWNRSAPRLLPYARSIVGPGAEDVVQSVFMAVLEQSKSQIRRVEDPIAWLLVLTRRCSLNHLRSTHRDFARRHAAASVARELPTPATDGEHLLRAMDNLPRRLREVVVLRHIAGLTFDQVATALGANRNTAAARYREAIRRLRMVLDASEPALAGSSP
jgi:RNA polymerase sigma-70 factor, ECF subfamily